jgi:hypothetical protein
MADITLTRAQTEVEASSTLTAGGNAQSDSFSPGTKLSYTYEVRITNGGTGPTVGMTAKVQYTPDSGTTWIDVPGLSRTQTVLTASANSSLWIPVPRDIGYPTRLDMRGNTAQSITIVARVHEVTKAVST